MYNSFIQNPFDTNDYVGFFSSNRGQYGRTLNHHKQAIDGRQNCFQIVTKNMLYYQNSCDSFAKMISNIKSVGHRC